MKRIIVLLSMLSVLLVLAGSYAVAEESAGQALPAETVAKGKKATALVEITSRGRKGYASAFCIDKSGFFVTCNHVVSGAARNGQLSLVLNPGESGQKVVNARVLRTDASSDLAVLQVEAEGLTALELGTGDELMETMPIYAFGYPFGTMLAEKEQEYPAITVTMGAISSLRKKGNELQVIQLNSQLNPGNSGGPLLDKNGRVIGVAVATIYGSSVSFAVPVTKVKTLVEKAEVQFEASSVASAECRKPKEFSVKVIRIAKQERALNVTLVLNPGEPGARTVVMKGEGGTYKASIEPVPPLKEKKRLMVTAQFATGTVAGQLTDFSVRVNDREVKLSDIRVIEQGAKKSVTFADLKQQEDGVAGLEKVTLEMGEISMKVDLSKAARVTVEDLDVLPASVPYQITVKAGEDVLAESSGTLAIAQAAGVASAPPVKPNGPGAAKFVGDKQSVKLPAPFTDVVVGGSGRYLFLAIPKLQKIAVFDVTQGKVSQFISVPSSSFLMAAGADCLCIAMTDNNLLQKWDLNTMQKVLTVPLDGQVTNLAMGSASSGPLLVNGNYLIDVATMKKMEMAQTPRTMSFPSDRPVCQASPDGRTFTAWRLGVSPSGMYVGTLTGNTIQWKYEHNSCGYLIPSSDGNLIFTRNGLYTSDLKRVSGGPRGAVFPSCGGSYFMQVQQYSDRAPQVSIYSENDYRTLVTVSNLDEMTLRRDEDSPFNGDSLETFKRYWLIPSANVFVTLPSSNLEVVVHKFDMLAVLEKAGIDYLFVDSSALRSVTKGGRYEYHMVVRSKKGGVGCSLESGPEGMKVSKDGVVTWSVPADFAESEVTVIVSVKDSAGQEIYHTFRIGIR